MDINLCRINPKENLWFILFVLYDFNIQGKKEKIEIENNEVEV